MSSSSPREDVEVLTKWLNAFHLEQCEIRYAITDHQHALASLASHRGVAVEFTPPQTDVPRLEEIEQTYGLRRGEISFGVTLGDVPLTGAEVLFACVYDGQCHEQDYDALCVGELSGGTFSGTFEADMKLRHDRDIHIDGSNGLEIRFRSPNSVHASTEWKCVVPLDVLKVESDTLDPLAISHTSDELEPLPYESTDEPTVVDAELPSSSSHVARPSSRGPIRCRVAFAYSRLDAANIRISHIRVNATMHAFPL